jgi:hypothetical protein
MAEIRRRHWSRRFISLLLSLLVVLLISWVLFRPGVFTIQPIEALPEGVTYIYHSRGPEIPFFASADGLCLKRNGELTLLCRAEGISGSAELAERAFIRLPYSRWAYLRSTGGIEFDQ